MIPTAMLSAEIESPRFLGNSAPLRKAAKALLQRELNDCGELDLSNTLLVVPGRRAGRQFLLALAEESDALGIPLRPPRAVTPGELEFQLRPPIVAIASSTEVRLALVKALKEISDSSEGRLLPAGASNPECRALAERLIRADRELEVAGKSWNDVAQAASSSGGDPERYLLIGCALDRAAELLEAEGLHNPDRLRRMNSRSAPVDGVEVVLLGVVELPERIVTALHGVQVLVLVLSDAHQGFDEWGRLKTSWWHQHSPLVPLESISVEDKPIDQAESVLEQLVDYAGGEQLDPDGVALVMADESITEQVQRELDAAGCPVHRAQGRRVATLEPARVLADVAGYLETADSTSLRRVLAHPAVQRAIENRLDGSPQEGISALTALDTWFRHHHVSASVLQEVGDPEEKGISRFLAEARRKLTAITPVVMDLFKDLHAENPMRTAGEWVPEVMNLLEALFAERVADSSSLIQGALEVIAGVAREFVAAPSGLQVNCSAAEAIRMVLAGAGEEPVRSVLGDGQGPALEMLGWLEAPCDPAPRVLVAGFNDGAVPSTRGVDSLLPDSLREVLGLPCEHSRTARDAWVLSTILARDAHFILSRRDGRGEARVPSRLLFAAQGEELARRVLALTQGVQPRVHVNDVPTSCGRPLPPQGSVVELSRIPVTAFRQYLRCPYGFWLRYILRLESPDATGSELDPRRFGILLHTVLERFSRLDGADEIKDAGKIETIFNDFLQEELRRLAGAQPEVGLLLQERILKRRLARMAWVQAEQNRAGWQIHMVEHDLREDLEIPGHKPVQVRGKIDRVDFHPDLGWRILDLKTSDKGHSPDKAHHMQRALRWIDLQLPLYKQLLEPTLRARHDMSVSTGYFIAPAEEKHIDIVLSDRITGLHAEAIAKAREVVVSIRAGMFDPGETLPSTENELSMIYRVHSLGEDVEGEEE